MYVSTFKSGIGCMFTLSKVGFDICSHFQNGIRCTLSKKWNWMYVSTSKSRIMCLFTLSEVALDVCPYFLEWIGCMFTLPKVAFTLSKMASYICPHFQKWHLMLEVG